RRWRVARAGRAGASDRRWRDWCCWGWRGCCCSGCCCWHKGGWHRDASPRVATRGLHEGFMPTDAMIASRPRPAGEVLDDAWRLALADAPPLLALSGLFAVPAAAVLLILLTRPAPESLVGRCLLPALAALLLPLTGLGSGACQEWLRRRV